MKRKSSGNHPNPTNQQRLTIMKKQTIRATAIILQGLIGASSLQAYNWPTVNGTATSNQTQFTFASDSAYLGDTQDCWTKAAFSAATSRDISAQVQGTLRSDGSHSPDTNHSIGTTSSYINQTTWSANTYTRGIVQVYDTFNPSNFSKVDAQASS
jgi:hypothetical protein